MGIHPLGDPGPLHRLLDDLIDPAGGERLVLAEASAPMREEERIGTALSPGQLLSGRGGEAGRRAGARRGCGRACRGREGRSDRDSARCRSPGAG